MNTLLYLQQLTGRACEYGVCEIIRWQLYRQGISADRVLLHPFVMTDVEIGEVKTMVSKHLPSWWQCTTEEIVIVPKLNRSIPTNLYHTTENTTQITQKQDELLVLKVRIAEIEKNTSGAILTTLDHDLLMLVTLKVVETIQDIHVWHTVIRSKRAPNPGALAKIGRWRELDSIRALIRKEVVNQRPDDIVVDVNWRRICIIEVARTEDSTDQLRHVFTRKNTKYIQLMQQLRVLFPDFRTEQLTFVIGICGAIDEHLWRRQLTTLGLTVPKQNHLIQTCMKATKAPMHYGEQGSDYNSTPTMRKSLTVTTI